MPEKQPPRVACRLCGDGPETRPDLFALTRVNEKGIPGLWECISAEGCRARQALAMRIRIYVDGDFIVEGISPRRDANLELEILGRMMAQNAVDHCAVRIEPASGEKGGGCWMLIGGKKGDRPTEIDLPV